MKQPPTRPAIAWLVSQNEGFGIQRAVVALAAAASRSGCRAKVFALADGGMSRACREAGLDVEVLGTEGASDFRGSLWSKPAQLFRSWLTSRRLAKIIATRLRDERFDVLHWLMPNLMALGGLATSRTGVLGVWEMPNTVSDRYPLGLNSRLYRHLIRKHRVTVIADSRYTANSLAGGGVWPVVNYHATESARFDPHRPDLVQREALGIPADATVFAVFARLVPDKGAAELIEAVAGLPAGHEQVHVLLIGGPHPGPFVDQLKDLARRTGMECRVTIHPPVTDIERYYGAVDVACNTRVVAEPFGLSVAEAMLMRKPVLVHALGGPAESVVDGLTGWHYHAPDAAALREGIIRALADREKWPQMGEMGRQRALELFDADRLCDRYLRLVEARLRDRNAPSPI